MTKKKSSKNKPTELVILIRMPDADARRGEGSLTVQRGELGTLTGFNFTGLTLKHDVAGAVQSALEKLAALEKSPPPETSNEAEMSATEDQETEPLEMVEEPESEPAEESVPDEESRWRNSRYE